MKRVHIVGCSPRSGTTLMTELMGNCFGFDYCNQHEAPLSEALPRQCRLALTKKPGDVLFAPKALDENPDLYFIYLLRDPRDVIVSRHGGMPDRYWVGMNYWYLYTRVGELLKAHPRFISVRYEELVRHPNAIQNVIRTRLPFLRKQAKFTTYTQLAQPSKEALGALNFLRPINTDSIGAWRRNLPRIVAQMQRYGSLTPALQAYGYEEDWQWESLLHGVAPDLSPSHLEEPIPADWLQNVRQQGATLLL